MNRVFADQPTMLAAVMQTAAEIAVKTPLAVYGCKHMIDYARDHSTIDGPDYIGIWNARTLQDNEIREAMRANADAGRVSSSSCRRAGGAEAAFSGWREIRLALLAERGDCFQIRRSAAQRRQRRVLSRNVASSALRRGATISRFVSRSNTAGSAASCAARPSVASVVRPVDTGIREPELLAVLRA